MNPSQALRAGEELFCNYGYNPTDCPEWYKELPAAHAAAAATHDDDVEKQQTFCYHVALVLSSSAL